MSFLERTMRRRTSRNDPKSHLYMFRTDLGSIWDIILKVLDICFEDFVQDFVCGIEYGVGVVEGSRGYSNAHTLICSYAPRPRLHQYMM